VDVSDELWASSDWVPTSVEKHPWLKENKEEGRYSEGDKAKRWFVPRGHRWPLLCVSVYAEYPSHPKGVCILVSHKAATDAWFTNCSLPRDLVPALIEMLADSVGDELDRSASGGDR